MTRKHACTLLNIASRQLDYLLAAEGIRAGQRSHAGTLTPQATAAVQRLVDKRRHPVDSNSTPCRQMPSAPIAEAAPAPWRAYEHLHAQVIALQADTERLQGACEHAYAALCEQEARLAAMEAKSAVRQSWGGWWARLFPAPPVVVEREWPTTEVYSGSVLRRA